MQKDDFRLPIIADLASSSSSENRTVAAERGLKSVFDVDQTTLRISRFNINSQLKRTKTHFTSITCRSSSMYLSRGRILRLAQQFVWKVDPVRGRFLSIYDDHVGIHPDTDDQRFSIYHINPWGFLTITMLTSSMCTLHRHAFLTPKMRFGTRQQVVL